MSGALTPYFMPYQQAVTQALGYNPTAAAGAQPVSILDLLLAQEASSPLQNIQSEQAVAQEQAAAPQRAPAQPEGDSALGTAMQGAGYLNRARQLYNLGNQAYNAYNAGGAMNALGAVGAAAVPAAATAILAKGAQTLAKPGGEVGAGVGSAAGAALGTAIMPGFGTALGALLGGIAGGQIGPRPSVGSNFGALGTFDEQGNLRLSHQGGDNGGNAEQALALGGGLAEALPMLAAQRGLVFNPRAAGEQITLGGYANRGMFYSPTGYTPSPEVHAAFSRDPEAYLNIVLGDLAARGIYVPQGTTDYEGALANRHANIPMQVYRSFNPNSRALGDLINAATDTSFEGVLNRQRAAIEQWREAQARQSAEQNENAAREAAVQRFIAERGGRANVDEYGNPTGDYFVEGYGPVSVGNFRRSQAGDYVFEPPQQYARGGVVELEGGGKVAIGPGGGLDDLIPTSINGERAAALSDGEFVIPADVVSMMGDGSSNAGARRLYDLVKQVRQAKTGSAQQAGPLPVAKILERTVS